MRRWVVTFGLLWMGAAALEAEEATSAEWIWFDEGNPAENAPAGPVWFRREVRANEPSTGDVRIACDEAFTLWVNGQKVGSGTGGEAYRFNLNGIVGRGLNVIAVATGNTGGKAGLYVDGEIRGQGGRKIPFSSNNDWKSTRNEPAGDAWRLPRFDEAGWTNVKSLGPHEKSPWKEIRFASKSLDRFTPAPGLEIDRAAQPEVSGSAICMTWGPRGRLFVAPESGPLRVLIDEQGDGVYERACDYSGAVQHCQGLCWIGNALYAVGRGPQGAGMYRLPDVDQNDQADKVEHLTGYQGGIGEHGPHDVVLGPDGWLYHNLGNHAHIQHSPQPTGGVRKYYEGDLLHPRFEDALGHAVGIKAPGGTVWRFTPDAKKWYLETVGFRNHYDIAFNSTGDLFTFDSDMEWDVGEPWYKPVRVNHCVPGAEFGWRSGAGNWPDYYFDCLPATVDIGRGSPTGVLVYEHQQLPAKYRGAILLCDWSMGRILAALPKAKGASYTATLETVVSGNPLNVSDIEVDRDGSILFCTGGRGTEGGLYRIRAAGAPKRVASPKADTLDQLLLLPQFSAGWAREAAALVQKKLGPKDWQSALELASRTGPAEKQIRALTLLCQLGPKPGAALLLKRVADPDARVRAFATWLLGDHPGAPTRLALEKLLTDNDPVVRRRACEAFIRAGLEPPTGPLVALLGSDDPWQRFAARNALERVPFDKWSKEGLESPNPWTRLETLLAAFRLQRKVLDPQHPDRTPLALEKKLLATTRQPELRLATIRMVQLSLIEGAKGPLADEIAASLLRDYPTGNIPIDTEAARVFAWLSAPGAVDKLLARMASKETPKDQQIHACLCLRYDKSAWTLEQKTRLLDWYDTTRDWDGGDSFVPYLRNIVSAMLPRYTPAERKQLLLSWTRRPFASSVLIKQSAPAEIVDYDATVARMLSDLGQQPSLDRDGGMIVALIDALGKTHSPAAQATLRGLYEAHPDQRDRVARKLAEQPAKESIEVFLRALSSEDATVAQAALNALLKLKEPARGAADYRAVILAGLKFSGRPRSLATQLLDQWSKLDRLALYEAWFRATYPSEAPPMLAKEAAIQSKYTLAQLASFLEDKGEKGSPERGKKIFQKANCYKCHRFGTEGQGVGPDLSSVRRRFQRKEVLESVLDPSRVVSDQYKSVTIATADGLVYTGMLLPPPGPDKKALLLSNAERIEIAKKDIETEKPATASVMPEGLLNELSLAEIADLFAFIETSRFGELPASPVKGAANQPVTASGSR